MAAGPSTHFEQVFQDYVSRLSPKKQAFIGEIEIQNAGASPNELQTSVEQLVLQCKDRKLRRYFDRFLKPVIVGLDGFSGVIDQIVQAHPSPAALVWGGMKLLIITGNRYSNLFEQIGDQLKDLSDLLWQLASCDKVYSVSIFTGPTVQSIVGRCYVSIIDFWYKATKELRRSQIAQLAKSVTPGSKLKKALDTLKRDAALLERVCDTAEHELQHESRMTVDQISDAVVQARIESTIEAAANRENQKLMFEQWKEIKEYMKESAQAALANQRHQRAMFQFQLISTLRDDSIESRALLESMLDERHPKTGNWIFDTSQYLQWISENTSHPVLWLNGKHGIGKSFLCAGVAEKAMSGPTPPCVAIIFLAKGKDCSSVQLLRSVAYQIIGELAKLRTDLPDEIIHSLQRLEADISSVKSLIKQVIEELPSVYIFLDGLDEAQAETLRSCSFLLSEAAQNPQKIKLWFSSQYNSDVQSTIQTDYSHITNEISLENDDVQEDIETFLSSAIPDSTQRGTHYAKTMVEKVMKTESEGSFLWASTMTKELKSWARDSDDLVTLAQRKLPSDMSTYYATVIRRYMARDDLHPELPLWKIILSILAFAKRPLCLGELQEAVAIARAPLGKNLSSGKMVSLQDLRDECASLVRYIRPRDGEKHGTIVLSHSAVHAFLHQHSNKDKPLTDEPEHFVDTSVVRDCCLRYLAQARYSEPLSKRSHHDFVTFQHESISKHLFLLYAAKYWYRHCTELPDGQTEPSKDIYDVVTSFMKSRNFQTCLQIQSISIPGQFMMSFNEVTGLPRLMKENLPSWLRAPSESFRADYKEFLEEWIEVLQLGVTALHNGEIDRCFWGALGPQNFLQKNISRYSSYRLESADGTRSSEYCHQCYSVAEDGSRLTLIRLCFSLEDSKVFLRVEEWALEASPQVMKQNSLEYSCECPTPCWRFSHKDANEKLSLTCEDSWNISRGPVITDPSLHLVRLGSHGFALHTEGSELIDAKQGAVKQEGCHTRQGADKDSSTETDPMGGFWEYEAVMAPFRVVTRRREPIEPDADDQKEIRRIAKLQRRVTRRRLHNAEVKTRITRQIDALEENSDLIETELSEYLSNTLEAILKITNEKGDQNSDSDTSSTSSRQHTSESISDDLISLPDDGKSADDLSSGDSSDVESELHSLSALSDHSSRSSLMTASTASSGADSWQNQSDSDDASQADSLNEANESGHSPTRAKRSRRQSTQGEAYPAIISNRGLGKLCDLCNHSIKLWYTCGICEGGDLDLCKPCVKDGAWCFTRNHQLKQCSALGIHSVLSSPLFTPSHALRVYDSSADKVVIDYSSEEQGFLYDSPPVRHPSLPLLVWPIDGSKMLFADLGKLNRTRVHKMARSFPDASRLCVTCRFSSCGRYLYVASVDSAPVRDKSGSSNKSKSPPRFALSCSLKTLWLNPIDPVKRRPIELEEQNLHLGTRKSPCMTALPFSWTWTKEAAFFAIAGPTLGLYRFKPWGQDASLIGTAVARRAGGIKVCTSAHTPVMTISEAIHLPRSARERDIRFFPPVEGSNVSKLVLGPKQAAQPQPPIVVYLQPADLGEWVDTRVAKPHAAERAKRRKTGRFERFDEDDDCDIIPFDDEA